MNKLWFIVVVMVVAWGCAMAAESPLPDPAPAVKAVPSGVTAAPAAATPRKLPSYRQPSEGPSLVPVQHRTSGTGVLWSASDTSNATHLVATQLPKDIPAVRALHEQLRETLLVMVRRQVDMQINGSSQMESARNYRAKLRSDDPELLKMQQRLAELNSEREALNRQIDERFNQDPQYKYLTGQRSDNLQQLRDIGVLNAALRAKMAQLEQRQAELEREAALAATNQPQSAIPAVTIKQ